MRLAVGIVCLLCAINSLNAWAVDCNMWKQKVDPSVVYNGSTPDVYYLSPEEKMDAISCLMVLEGRRDNAKMQGAVQPIVSDYLPKVSVEIAALYYIRAIYLGKYDHCLGITLVSDCGKFNKRRDVKKVWTSYNKWYAKVRKIGIEEARKQGLDPMDDCPGVNWY